MMRAPIVQALIIIVALLVGAGGALGVQRLVTPAPHYAGAVEEPGALDYPESLPSHGRDVEPLVMANTGKDIQQLFLRVQTKGTLAIKHISAFVQIGAGPNSVDYSQGPVLVAARPTDITPLDSFPPGGKTWDLGDLPHGYHMIVLLRLRHLKPKPKYGYILNSHWYAGLSTAQPRDHWHLITGEDGAGNIP